MDFTEILQHHLLDHPLGVFFAHHSYAMAFTKHELMLSLTAGLLVLMAVAIPKGGAVPTGLANLLETFVVFIRDEIVLPNMGEEGKRYLPYFLTLFFFILITNLLGLIPFGSTATGNITVSGALALCTFALIHVAGIREHGFAGHVKGLVPRGLPKWLIPLMFPIELVGLIAKCFALTIRLFANMIAGHIVILALICLIFLLGSGLAPFVAPVSVAAAASMMALEIFTCFLQAYIFCLLTSIFVGASIHQH